MTLAAVVAGAPARAADHQALSAQASDDAAKVAYHQGAADYALGHFHEALAKFELAYKLKQAPSLLFNIAQCHRQLKEFDEAVTTYRSFIRLDPESSQVGLAKELLVQVEAAVHAQNVAQRAPPQDANGHDAPEAKPGPQPLGPVIATTHDGGGLGSPLATSASTDKGSKNDLNNSAASPGLIAKASPGGNEQRAESRSHLPVWIAGGATVVALGAGCAFGVMSKSTASDISGTQHSRTEVDSLQSKLNTQSSTANILFVAGGALALATGALFFFKF